IIVNKEILEIIKYFESVEPNVTKTVLVTVVDVQGSSYRLPGARMLVGERGEMLGTVSGGCLETDVLERASRVLQTGAAEVFTYDTTAQEDSVFSLNMGCRGVIRILLERPAPDFIDFCRRIYQTRRRGLAATLIGSKTESERVGARLILDEDNLIKSDFSEETTENLLADCAAVLGEKKSRLLENDFGEFFLEFIPAPVSLVIFGAGADAIPVLDAAKNLGWRVSVVDHRAAFANRERFAAADEIILTRSENLAGKLTIDENTVAVVMSHNYEHDKNTLNFLLNSDARYIGALGPKRRTENILHEWRAEGADFSDKQLEKLYAPIGLDIGADTPESIALSIIAEIKSVLTDRSGGFLRRRNGSIYNR
ncbi:MAG: XdhC family protein, partial [Pyrinomonadaceae bacterium]